jgi:hypothetical protein
MRDEGSAGPRLPQATIRDERLKLATEMIALTHKDVGLMLVKQQEQVRLAMKALTDVQTWCKRHPEVH